MKNNWKDFNITNGRESNYLEDGRNLLTYGLLAFIASDMHKGDSSHSGLEGRDEGAYYYEDKLGHISENAISYYTMSHDGVAEIATIVFVNGEELHVFCK